MLKNVLRLSREALQNGGIENADFEAQCIVEHVTGFDRAGQIAHGEAELSAAQKQKINSIIERRLTRYPLQYLLGSWSFMGFELSVGEGVLIPRDDTEVCVGLCLDYLKGRSGAKAVDLCAGSGAISIALEKLSNAEVSAVELSDKAFYFLEKNIKDNNCGIKAIKGDVLTCHRDFEDGSLDLIVSNPPDIKSGDLPALQAEVLHEPELALDGGGDGLDFYRAIVKNWSSKLKRGGALVFELGEGQADDAAALMSGQGYSNIRTELDFGGCQRAIIGTML